MIRRYAQLIKGIDVGFRGKRKSIEMPSNLFDKSNIVSLDMKGCRVTAAELSAQLIKTI
jgi:hypothetical protein